MEIFFLDEENGKNEFGEKKYEILSGTVRFKVK